LPNWASGNAALEAVAGRWRSRQKSANFPVRDTVFFADFLTAPEGDDGEGLSSTLRRFVI
jgi:hypothetical protein